MSVLPVGIGASGDEYTLDNSLRFRQSASAYLTRTPSSTGDRTEWTWSAWVKHSALGTNFGLFSVDSSAATNRYLSLLINNSDEFQIFEYTGSAYTLRLATNAVFRDPSAWYHLVCAVDTDQATSSDRVKLYVNGVQQTSLRLSTYPSSGLATYANVSGNEHAIGATVGATTTPDRYMDGYMTEINFIDGQQLAPTDFGETDEDTGVWKPKAYSGTYGTNGFYLDGSGVTDSSGNGNNWTNNNLNLSTSSATTYDLMTDVPTLTDENTANYCTWNPLDKNATVVADNGNLDANSGATASQHRMIRGTLGVTEKSYFEITTSGGSTGMVTILGAAQQTSGVADGVYVGSFNKSFGLGYATNAANFYAAGVTQANGSATNLVDGTWGVAIDPANGKAWMRNTAGNWIGGGDPAAGTLPTFTWTSDGLSWFPAISFYNIATSFVATLNAGQRPFAYTSPIGFKALNTYNLPDSTIEDGSEHFNTVLYTGNGSTQSITGVNFQPDAVWIKSRSQVSNHGLHDALRLTAGGNPAILYPNDTAAESSGGRWLNTLDSDGFTLNSNTAGNNNGSSYVSWNWKANGSGVSNSIGTIPSTVSANTTSGFSVLTYTGNATSGATVGHGLGIAPKFLFTKSRTTGTYDWVCQHTSLGGTKRIWLNLTSAENTSSGPWNNTDASASVVTLGNFAETNANGDNFVMYCFADVEGFSSFGSYTGNGSSDGPFVYTGFRPAWLLVKRSDAAYFWYIHDAERNTYNVLDKELYPNANNAEVTATRLDFTSNGFKVRGTQVSQNASGGTYIYAAFAENPFKNSLAR